MQHKHFRELREWSERKHELIVNYLKGFVRILGGSTRGIVYYVDGFAGPGIYDDGSKGSPVRAADYAQTLVGKHYQLYCINVEANRQRFDNLKKNTVPYGPLVTNHHGTFASHVDEILEQVGDRPTILFIDPFGLKGIEWEHLCPILGRPHTTEILLRISHKDIGRLAGFADSETRGAARKRRVLTDLFGFGDSGRWEQVWHSDGTDGLVKLYLDRLWHAMSGKRGGPYVCAYPIKTIEGRLKYHLVFATRHPKGAVLMSDTIYGRERSYERDVKEYEKERQEQQPVRQLSMLQVLDPPPSEEELFARVVRGLKKHVWDEFRGEKATRIDVHKAMLPVWFGRMKGSHLTWAFRELEKEDKIIHCSGARSNDSTEFTFRAD
jgi:three-Cys-motif partner protein